MIAGAAVGLAAVVGLAIAARTPVAAPLGRAVRQRTTGRATGADPVIVAVPQSLGAAAGDLVHLQRSDGETEVVGRVVRTVARSATTDELQLELLSPAVDQVPHPWLSRERRAPWDRKPSCGYCSAPIRRSTKHGWSRRDLPDDRTTPAAANDVATLAGVDGAVSEPQ